MLNGGITMIKQIDSTVFQENQKYDEGFCYEPDGELNVSSRKIHFWKKRNEEVKTFYVEELFKSRSSELAIAIFELLKLRKETFIIVENDEVKLVFRKSQKLDDIFDVLSRKEKMLLLNI